MGKSQYCPQCMEFGNFPYREKCQVWCMSRLFYSLPTSKLCELCIDMGPNLIMNSFSWDMTHSVKEPACVL